MRYGRNVGPPDYSIFCSTAITADGLVTALRWLNSTGGQPFFERVRREYFFCVIT